MAEVKTAKWALVTGGSRGIGRAIALELARKHGLSIVLNYASNQEAAEAAAVELKEMGVDVFLAPFDVKDPEAVKSGVDAWRSAHPEARLEVLINNAGITRDNLLVFMEPADWHEVINTHLNGFFNVTTAVLQGLVRQRYGRIINVVSLSGTKGVPGQTNYSAAKAGIIGATRSLAQEIAKRNITVNAVAPGFITSDMTKDLDEAQLKQLVPMGRFGKPEEVASIVGFLASAEAAYITGEVIHVNGGMHS
ncbi:MAG: 3-oxoacyl-ACP reductase FabG [Flavobacteriales bacterium]|nr:3-oxoacyl-ACP reductase FabG [Flavobacteriales bacterium]MBK6943467.1 3-oxoacyl-ACP reductase FabG [Flavobacteriales bacterium]MBK7240646.1 3-oxoacyl-ACP reductase FabG [Flavobacteriales bacterium]MBK9535996.1 3-oxoacyl-ACP reductase FabG [Flavobacteriales bacterium]MBP9139991.1 3-oxoacyl-ACP reductase FabG [Flavobacteriales bacterium]